MQVRSQRAVARLVGHRLAWRGCVQAGCGGRAYLAETDGAHSGGRWPVEVYRCLLCGREETIVNRPRGWSAADLADLATVRAQLATQ